MTSDHPPRATIDFESRSARSLKASGAWRYSQDPTTEVLCLGYRLPRWPLGRVDIWHPAFPTLGIPELPIPSDLVNWITKGGLIEAHNAWFERCMWQNQLIYHGFPAIPAVQWRCSAAKAAAHALPRGLDDAISALNLPVTKDMEGHKLMKKMMKPRKPRKKEREGWTKAYAQPLLWWEDPASMAELWRYCQQDVRAEAALSLALPDLDTQETAVFLLDAAINERGFQLDADAVVSALTLSRKEVKALNTELCLLTGVKRATMRGQMLSWFEVNGFWLPNTQAATLDAAVLRENIPPVVKRAVEIVRNLGHSSTAKYQKALSHRGTDWRVRGGLLYHGATTGRWSGSGVQPHNFPRPTLKDLNMQALWRDLKGQDRTLIMSRYKTVMDALSNGLRGMIIAPEGKTLYVADYASIEARVTFWLAGDADALQIFERGDDIYCWMASDIYGYPCNKVEHPHERQMGKQAILGLGYQMGWSKFQTTVAGYGIEIDDAFAQNVVTTYREKFHLVKSMWYGIEEAACRAVLSPTQRQDWGPVAFYVQKPFLYCELPSGRRLAYPFPEVRPTQTSWGAIKDQLTYKGIDPYVHQWRRQHTYGGMLVENIVQAISRDIMAEAMLRCEGAGYPVVLSVHDEVLTEVETADPRHSLAQFTDLLTLRPSWAPDCPIAADGWEDTRYRK